jgi:3-hydroxybutyryl-CoA dehydrogenase
MHNIKTIGVIGAGQMGGGIAQVAAVTGFKVVVFDAMRNALTRCEDQHRKRLMREVEKQRMTPAQVENAISHLTYTDNLEMLKGADIFIEAIVEDAGVKKDLFKKLVAMATHNQVLATNTSSISITEIAVAAGAAAERVIGMHFFNPVPVMKLVEVIKGLQTSEKTTHIVMELAKAMGKTPIPASDRAGFVSNRVLMPMINEAFYAWMEGVAQPEHIDEIMKLGCNFPMGPLRLADFIGLDTCVHIMEVLAEGLNNDRYRACPLLKQLVTAGRLGDKSGRGVFDYTQQTK